MRLVLATRNDHKVSELARMMDGVVIEPGAVIGPRVAIGAGSVIAANAVIGSGVQIGRDCAIGANSTISNALLGDRVEFLDLGLVVVDEQHRFGVDQREALRRKGGTPPHVLVLTATPIPRTVAMTVFGDLDVSTIAELPSGRQPIESFVVPLHEQPRWIERVWERTAEEMKVTRSRTGLTADTVAAPRVDRPLGRAGTGAGLSAGRPRA